MSFFYDLCGENKGKRFWKGATQIILILLAGLRYRVGVDTLAYLNRFYEQYPSLGNFSVSDYPIGSDPLFVILNSVVITIGGRFYIVQLIHAAFVILLISRYVNKHSKYYFTFLLLYFLFCFREYNMEIMRGSMCVVVSLYGNDYVQKRKWLKGYMLYFFAMLFHVQAVLCFLYPLFLRIKFNKKTVVFLLLSYIVGDIIQNNFGDIIALLNIIGNSNVQGKLDMYAVSDFYLNSNSSRNINYMIVNCFPLLFYSFASLIYVKRYSSENELKRFESFVLLGLFFQVLYIRIFIIYRLVEFVEIYMLLYITQMFVDMVKRVRNKEAIIRLRTITLIFPFFFLTVYAIAVSETSWRYFPYASVIDRSVDKNREKEFYGEMLLAGRPDVGFDKY